MAKPLLKIKNAPIVFSTFSQRQLQVLTWWLEDSPVKDMTGIICDGAIRSGKTLIMSMSYIMWSMENFNGTNFGIAGKTIASLKRNLVTTLIQVMRVRGYKIKERRADNLLIITYKGHTNYYYLFGGRDEASQDLVQGFTAGGFFFDEVTLMPRSFVEQCRARCSVEGAKQWYNCNPSSPYHWFKTEILDRADKMNYLHLHFVLQDNPSLSKGKINEYMNMYSGVFYSRYILGKWVVGDGIIYDNFDDKTMVFDANVVNRCKWSETYVACDYGTANATTFKKWSKSLTSIADGRNQIRVGDWVCRDEYYYSGRETKKQKTDRDYVKDMKEFCKEDCAVYDNKGNFVAYDWSRMVIILDPSALSFRTALKKAGFRVRRAKNDILNGIRVMASLMNQGIMKYSSVCEITFKEFGSYVWDEKVGEKGEDKPVPQNDHCLDADRYFAYTIIRKRVGMQIWK